MNRGIQKCAKIALDNLRFPKKKPERARDCPRYPEITHDCSNGLQ